MATALRRELLSGALDGLLEQHGGDLATLRGGDARQVLDRIDASPPDSRERDALLADLVRLHRRSPGGTAFGLLFYAFTEILRGMSRSRRGVPAEEDENLSDLALALATCSLNFDPDRRSARVQAGLLLDVRHARWTARTTGKRRREAEQLTITDESASAPVGDEFVHAMLVLRSLIARGRLTERDVLLLFRTRVEGVTYDEVATEYGMRGESVRKALQRAFAIISAIEGNE